MPADDWLDARRPVRRVQRRPDAATDPSTWPYCLPPVAQLLRDGLDLPRLEWSELDLVDHWRRSLGEPQAHLRHVVG